MVRFRLSHVQTWTVIIPLCLRLLVLRKIFGVIDFGPRHWPHQTNRLLTHHLASRIFGNRIAHIKWRLNSLGWAG